MSTTTTTTTTSTGSPAPLAGVAEALVAELGVGAEEVHGELSGRFAIAVEAMTHAYVDRDVLAEDLNVLARFVYLARCELRAARQHQRPGAPRNTTTRTAAAVRLTAAEVAEHTRLLAAWRAAAQRYDLFGEDHPHCGLSLDEAATWDELTDWVDLNGLTHTCWDPRGHLAELVEPQR